MRIKSKIGNECGSFNQTRTKTNRKDDKPKSTMRQDRGGPVMMRMWMNNRTNHVESMVIPYKGKGIPRVCHHTTFSIMPNTLQRAHTSRVHLFNDANKRTFQAHWGTITHQEVCKEFGPGNALYPTTQKVSEM
jgi:hypothetical protein